MAAELDEFGDETAEAFECIDWWVLSDVLGVFVVEDAVKTGLVLKEKVEFRGADAKD